MAQSNYKNLIVWQKSIELVEQVYALAKLLPSSEQNVLSDQIRRAAISVSSNIAEGKCRYSKRECRQFLRIAYASCAELDTQLTLSRRLGFIEASELEVALDLCDQILRMLNVLIRHLSKP